MNNDFDSELMERLEGLWVNANNAIRQRDYASAIDTLNSILLIDEKNASSHNRLGIVYAKLGLYKKSLHHLKKAQKYDKNSSSEHNLGLLYYEIGKYQLAKRHLENALQIEPMPLAARHVALAKVYEKIKNYSGALEQLDFAIRLAPSQKIQQIYIDAYKRHGVDNKHSNELLDALGSNKVVWNYEILDNYPLLLDALQSSHQALEDMVYSKTLKRLSPRSENTKTLAVAYLHNLNASIFLLNKSYSLAGANLARSMFEIYLKTAYGVKEKTNRGFAELERSTLIEKQRANTRLLKHISTSDDRHHNKVLENKKYHKIIKNLDRRYVRLKAAPSYRTITLMLDDYMLGNNYRLYEQLYEKGSDIIHAESSSIKRTALLSGTKQAGLAIDSYELLNIIQELTWSFGGIYATLPELTSTTAKKYNSRIKTIQQSFALQNINQPIDTQVTTSKPLDQPRKIVL